jgi:hypothetical protein
VPITLVLGAGASLANALHFRSQRMASSRPPLDTTFFQTVRARRIPFTPAMRTYLTNVAQVDPDGEELRAVRMEEVFKDVFFDFQDSPSNASFLDAYIDLVELYLRVLRETTNWLNESKRVGAPIGRLISDAAGADDDVSIVTFNHDLVIENEIQKRPALRSRWCLEGSYGSIVASMGTMAPTATRVATFQTHDDGLCDHGRLIRIFKLHGSLNWVVRLASERPTANFLSGRTQRPMSLLTRRQISVSQIERRSGSRGRSVWNLWPVVVPPVYAKQALRASLHDAWDDARASLTRADRVIFFGYSLPPIDIEAEKLFQRALAANNVVERLEIINPDPLAAGRYAALARLPVRWYPSMQDFFAAGGAR